MTGHIYYFSLSYQMEPFLMKYDRFKNHVSLLRGFTFIDEQMRQENICRVVKRSKRNQNNE